MNASPLKTFRNSSINLKLNPLCLYVLADDDNAIKLREVLKKIGKRKTVTGNIFSIEIFQKESVVGGSSRKALRNYVGDSNIIAEIISPKASVPKYLISKIEFNPDNIQETADRIRDFVKELVDKDIESLQRSRLFPLSRPEENLVHQFKLLSRYLAKNSSVKKSLTRVSKVLESKQSINRPKAEKPHQLSDFWNGAPDFQIHHCWVPSKTFTPRVEEPESEYKEKFHGQETYTAEEIKRSCEELGLDFEEFKVVINRKRQAEKQVAISPIINTDDVKLRFIPVAPNSRFPGLEFKFDKKEAQIKLGGKMECILFVFILFFKIDGQKFQRSVLIDVVESVKERFKNQLLTEFKEGDYKVIPNLKLVEKIYKTVTGENTGDFLDWCKHSFKVSTLNQAATNLNTNTEEFLKKGGLSDFQDLLKIKKERLEKEGQKTHKQFYYITFPISKLKLEGKWKEIIDELPSSSTRSAKTQVSE